MSRPLPPDTVAQIRLLRKNQPVRVVSELLGVSPKTVCKHGPRTCRPYTRMDSIERWQICTLFQPEIGRDAKWLAKRFNRTANTIRTVLKAGGIARPIPFNRTDPAKRDRVRKMWLEGVKAEVIMAETGLSDRTVRAYTRDIMRENPFRLTRKQEHAVLRYVELGYCYADIAALYGVSPSCIGVTYRRYRGKRQRRGKRRPIAAD